MTDDMVVSFIIILLCSNYADDHNKLHLNEVSKDYTVKEILRDVNERDFIVDYYDDMLSIAIKCFGGDDIEIYEVKKIC